MSYNKAAIHCLYTTTNQWSKYAGKQLWSRNIVGYSLQENQLKILHIHNQDKESKLEHAETSDIGDKVRNDTKSPSKARGVWGQAPRKILDFWPHVRGIWSFLVYSWGEIANPRLLQNLVVFEAGKTKGVTPLGAAEAAKQLFIHVRHGKISGLIQHIAIPTTCFR